MFSSPVAPVTLECRVQDPALPVGTPVEVEVTDQGSRWLVPVLLAYGLPTVGLIAGALMPEPWTPLTTILGLVGGLLAWRSIEPTLQMALTERVDVDAATALPAGDAVARRIALATGNQNSSGENA